MPRQRRKNHRQVSCRLFIVYKIAGVTYRMTNVSLHGFKRPNSRSITELEKLLAKFHGTEENGVIITDYKLM